MVRSAASTESDWEGSAFYQHFLTPAQFRSRFAPDAATVTSVKRWLKGEGIKVTGVEPSSRYVAAQGATSAVEAAFGTKLREFRKDGETFRAPTASASVPASVSSAVLAVSGLDTATSAMKPEAGSTLNGSGQTVAITDAYAAPTILADANTYATRHGDPAFQGSQFGQRNASKLTDKTAYDQTGWYGEESLDVEAVHAMAPAAGVLYYGAASCTTPTSPTRSTRWSTTTRRQS